MRSPNVKQLAEHMTNWDEALAKEVRRLIRANYGVQSLRSIDKLLGVENECFGVEYVRGKRWGFYYINTGDAYSATIAYIPSTGTVQLTTWGDIVEKHERNFRDGE